MNPTPSFSAKRPNDSRSDKSLPPYFLDSACGKEGDTRILVAYASGFGTTAEVAEFIGQTFCQQGARVDIKWIKKVENLESYDAVVIGSAIQYDRWLPEARKFVQAHQAMLSKIPVAFFFTCLTLSSQAEQAQRQAMTYANKIAALLPQAKPEDVGRFAGVLDSSRMNIVLRIAFKLLSMIKIVDEGDYRDWDAIRSWTELVHSRFIIKKNVMS